MSKIIIFLFSAIIIAAPLLAQESENPIKIKLIPILFLFGGLILLVFGWKLYRIMISATGLLLGLYLAYQVHRNFEVSATLLLMLIAIFSIAGFLLAKPFQKLVIFFLGGFWGILLVDMYSHMLDKSDPLNLMLAMALGFLLTGSISLFLLKPVMIICSSLAGSFSLLIGCYALLQHVLPQKVLNWIDPAHKGFFCFLLIAFLGVLIQHGMNRIFPEDENKKQSKHPEPAPAEADKD